jgi:hypothetical protein
MESRLCVFAIAIALASALAARAEVIKGVMSVTGAEMN